MNLETSNTDPRLSAERVQAIYDTYSRSLSRFLIGLLRDEAAADDALQSTLGKLIEKGHTANADSIKSWLFQVAYHEAMMLRRKDQSLRNLTQRAAWTIQQAEQQRQSGGLEAVLQAESVDHVRRAIDRLLPEQRQVLQMRVYEGVKFKEIASQLGLPLGTVLSRMQIALRHLRRVLSAEGFDF